MSSRLGRCCSALPRGIYSCKCGDAPENEHAASTTVVEKCWWWAFLLIFVFAITWLFCWSVFSNDYNDFNWYIYDNVEIWFGWGVLILSVITVLVFYLVLIFCSGLALIGKGEFRHLHLCNKISISFVLLLCIVAYILISLLWNEEFYVAVVGLMMIGPWLHIALLFVVTITSWVMFHEIMLIQNKKKWILANACVLIFFLFVCLIPLFISSPCVGSNLGSIPKPEIIAHRLGLTKYAPENTVLAYEEGNNTCQNFAVESDVSISYDGIPFLMHDTKNMKRTTNVEEVFPDLADQPPQNFLWSQLQKLDAGSWFLKQDPFRTVRFLSEDYKNKVRQQKIPSLNEIAGLIGNHSIIFDLFTPNFNHPFYLNYTEVALNALLDAGLPPNQILWLPGNDRSDIRKRAPGIRMVATNAPIEFFHLNNISIVNLGYYENTPENIANYVRNNVSVILYRIESPWLFSYAWCQGVSYVTTHSCDLLSGITNPVWSLTEQEYTAIWVCVDVFFLLILVAIFLAQYYRSDCVFIPILNKRRFITTVSGYDNINLELD